MDELDELFANSPSITPQKKFRFSDFNPVEISILIYLLSNPIVTYKNIGIAIQRTERTAITAVKSLRNKCALFKKSRFKIVKNSEDGQEEARYIANHYMLNRDAIEAILPSGSIELANNPELNGWDPLQKSTDFAPQQNRSKDCIENQRGEMDFITLRKERKGKVEKLLYLYNKYKNNGFSLGSKQEVGRKDFLIRFNNLSGCVTDQAVTQKIDDYDPWWCHPRCAELGDMEITHYRNLLDSLTSRVSSLRGFVPKVYHIDTFCDVLNHVGKKTDSQVKLDFEYIYKSWIQNILRNNTQVSYPDRYLNTWIHNSRKGLCKFEKRLSANRKRYRNSSDSAETVVYETMNDYVRASMRGR